MANPTTREELKKYCLRRLGAPVVEINVDEDQVQDRIDDALAFYHDYHYDGTERTFLKHQLTASDITNKYIAIPTTVNSIIDIFPLGNNTSSNNIFNAKYQITLNDIQNWTGYQFANFVMSMERIALMQELLVGRQRYRFSRHTDKLYLDTDWSSLTAGEYVIIECYKAMDPETYSQVYGDWWLRRYATALIKKQWGQNLSKFEGMQLPGGVTFNGTQILADANEEIAKLEEEVITNQGGLVFDLTG
jgi:hypothetical protein